MTGRIKVALLFGGRSAEHEVSCASARHVAAAMDAGRYQVVPVGITLKGQWVLPELSVEALRGGPLEIPQEAFEARGAPISLDTGSAPWAVSAGGLTASLPALSLDVVFPVLHGPQGEDGAVQGLLELAGYPYVGSGVLGSAMGMDKQKMKLAFEASGIPMASYLVMRSHQWASERDRLVAEAAGLGFPLFTKPANLGSSVGITRCTDPASLAEGIDLAFKHDDKVVVEEGIAGREIECAVLGNHEPQPSVCGEILPGREFYDYEAKYIDQTSRTVVPADLPAPVSELIRRYSVRAFQAVDAAGMARVDFFYEEGGRGVLVNEINTIPGFTTISMFPKLWEASGLPYPELIDRLIELALELHSGRLS